MMQRQSPALPGNFHNYLTTLSLIDAFLIFIFFLDSIVANHHADVKEAWYYYFTPYILHPMKSISLTMSVLWVMVMAVERYLAVSFPLKTGHRYNCYLLFLTSFSFGVNWGRFVN